MPESLRLFSICQAMNFAQLPMSGGIYEQHPQLLDEWLVIWRVKAEHDAAEAEDRKNQQPQGRGR